MATDTALPSHLEFAMHKPREGATVAMARTIILHSKPDAPVIDAFECSDCEWRYAMRQPMQYDISEQDAMQACREFDDHSCETFKRSKQG